MKNEEEQLKKDQESKEFLKKALWAFIKFLFRYKKQATITCNAEETENKCTDCGDSYNSGFHKCEAFLKRVLKEANQEQKDLINKFEKQQKKE